MRHIKKKEGFTLLELSVVLVVVALVLGASISLGAARIEAQNINSTREKLDSIEQALNRYISQGSAAIVNGLPCPADGSLPPTNAAYGFSVATCDATGYANIFNNTIPNTGDIIGGVVPTGTLFLPPEYMLDGWGNKFSYHIDRRFSLVANMQTDPTGTAEKIVVKTSCGGGATCTNTPNGTNNITNQAILVILSHGPDGFGAWRRVASGANVRTATPTDADELANYATGCTTSAAANTCGNYDRTFVARTTDINFDDIVRFKQRWQLIPVESSGGVVRQPTANCNRPPPGTADLTYNCTTPPRNCVATNKIETGAAITGTFATGSTLYGYTCIDVDGCWASYEVFNEAAGFAARPYICSAPDGTYVLCAESVVYKLNQAGPAGLESVWYTTTPKFVSDPDPGDDCVWMQY